METRHFNIVQYTTVEQTAIENYGKFPNQSVEKEEFWIANGYDSVDFVCLFVLKQ